MLLAQLPEFGNIGIAVWALVCAAVLGPVLAVLVSLRDRQRLQMRLGNLEDVLRRMRSSDGAGQFDNRPDESPLQLSRERLVLQNLLDRFPEITQQFVTVDSIEGLGVSLLEAFERVLETDYGVVFVRRGDTLHLMAEQGMHGADCHPGMTIPMGSGRLGYVAHKCLILRTDDFGSLDPRDRVAIEKSRAIKREFDFYVPMVHQGDALGCVAVGGMKKRKNVVSKAHTVSMALANLGALVLTNIQRAAEIRALSETDPLTRLSNRRHFYELLELRLKDRKTRPFALFLFDIDHFKRINDEFGHAVGDEVLVHVADLTRDFVRVEEGEFACRFGGEEFICLVDCEDVPSLGARLESFRNAVARIEMPMDPRPPAVRVSGGVAFCPAEEEDADHLIRLADDRLYAAKAEGRNRIHFESNPREAVP